MTPAGAAEDAALAAATEDEDVALEAATDDEDDALEAATDDEDVALEAATEDEDAALEATEEATKALPADVLAAAELAAPTLALLAPAAGVPDAPIVKSYKPMIVSTNHD